MRPIEMKQNNAPGCLITFCGLDGSGKSTMIRMLTGELLSWDHQILLTKQPTDAMRRSEIFRTFMDCPDHSQYDYRSLSLMAAADRMQHVSRVIMPALKEGKTVVSDRYFYSCLANLRARGYGEDTWIYDIVRHIPKPDYAFFLDVPVETAVRRVRERPAERDRYIDMDLQYRLAEEYRTICREWGGILIPSSCSIRETFEMVKQYLISDKRDGLKGNTEHESGKRKNF